MKGSRNGGRGMEVVGKIEWRERKREGRIETKIDAVEGRNDGKVEKWKNGKEEVRMI